MQHKTEFKGVVFLSLTAIIWGSGIVGQYIGSEFLNPFAFNCFRCIVGIFAILIMILTANYIKYKKIIFFTKDENKFKIIKTSFVCGISLFLGMILQQIGVGLTEAAKASFIASLTVILVPIVTMFFGRKIRFITWVFIITTLIGIVLLNNGASGKFNKGDIICFISTCAYTIDILQISKNAGDIDSLKFSFFRFTTVCILSFILMMIIEVPTIQNIKSGMPAVLYTGLFSIGIAYTFQIIGQKHCDSVIATLIMSFEGMFGAIFAYIILGQKLDYIQILGCIVMTISIVLVQLTNNNYENSSL